MGGIDFFFNTFQHLHLLFVTSVASVVISGVAVVGVAGCPKTRIVKNVSEPFPSLLDSKWESALSTSSGGLTGVVVGWLVTLQTDVGVVVGV